jgi:hypothetical protein
MIGSAGLREREEEEDGRAGGRADGLSSGGAEDCRPGGLRRGGAPLVRAARGFGQDGDWGGNTIETVRRVFFFKRLSHVYLSFISAISIF